VESGEKEGTDTRRFRGAEDLIEIVKLPFEKLKMRTLKVTK
jgi:hypothetical protein